MCVSKKAQLAGHKYILKNLCFVQVKNGSLSMAVNARQ